MHYQYILIGASIAMATVLGTFVLSYPPQAEPETMDAELAEPYVYVPSDITKANPNIRVSRVDASWRTTDIRDIADEVKYTIRGTILEVQDPINSYSYDHAMQGFGSIPVVMSVDEVYKGNLESDTLTFFLGSFITYPDRPGYIRASIADVAELRKGYSMFSYEPQFEVGDHVIVHVGEVYWDEDRIVDPQDLETMTPYHSVLLAKYGAYHIHDGKIYNEKVPDGAPLARAIAESQPAG